MKRLISKTTGTVWGYDQNMADTGLYEIELVSDTPAKPKRKAKAKPQLKAKAKTAVPAPEPTVQDPLDLFDTGDLLDGTDTE